MNLKSILLTGTVIGLAGLVFAVEPNVKIINEPVILHQDLVIDAGRSLTIDGNGILIQGGNARVLIHGSFSAPGRKVFQNFKPGEVIFKNPAAIPHALPQWWGARADGKADDAQAIQSALDAKSRKIYFPAGKYLVNTALNATDRPGDVTLEGAGASVHGSYNGSFLVGNTGDIVLDTSGTQCFTMSNIGIVSGTDRPSTVGILFQRTQKQKFSQFCSIQNVSINLNSNASANKGKGTIAIYNNAAELWRASNVVLIADIALAIVGENIFDIKSRYANFFPDFTSNSECSVDGASTLIGRAGPALVVQNLASLELNNTYLNRWGIKANSTETENGPKYAIEILGMLNFAKLNGHQEGYPGFMHCRGILASADINYSNWRVATPIPAILLDGRNSIAGIHSSTIRYCNNNPKDIPHPLVKSVGSRISGFSENTVWLFKHQSLAVQGGRISGNIIRSDFRTPSIELNPSEDTLSFQLMTPAGITFGGPVNYVDTTALPRTPATNIRLQDQADNLFGGTSEI